MTNKRYYSIGSTAVAVATKLSTASAATAPTYDYLFGDARGSTTLTVQAGTGAAQSQRYSAYGALRGTQRVTSTSRGYIGQQQDTTGLAYLNNRYHDPQLGVFLSVDPLVAATGEAYIFASANPATLSDPTGLCVMCSIALESERKARLERVYETFQARDDEYITSWKPEGLSGTVFDWLGQSPIGVTRSEAEMLDSIGMLGLREMSRLKELAFGVANQRFPSQSAEPGNFDHNDAFRHAYWMALLTNSMGAEFAENYGIARERIPGNEADRESMDLYNNSIGVRIAMEAIDEQAEIVGGGFFPTLVVADEADLANRIEVALRAGALVVVPSGGGRLAWSNEVDSFSTGVSDGRVLAGDLVQNYPTAS